MYEILYIYIFLCDLKYLNCVGARAPPPGPAAPYIYMWRYIYIYMYRLFVLFIGHKDYF